MQFLPGVLEPWSPEGGGSLLGSRDPWEQDTWILAWPASSPPAWPGSWGPLGLAPTLPPPLSSADGSRSGHRQLSLHQGLLPPRLGG